MPKKTAASTRKWTFPARFRKGMYSWKGSQKAAVRVKEAVSEIKAVARRDPERAAEGAVRFVEQLVPAIEHIDTSSGTLGTAVNNAIWALVPVIGKAPLASPKRVDLLERLRNAWRSDDYGFLDPIPACWAELCADEETLLHYVNEMEQFELWDRRAYFGCLFALGRFPQLVALLERERPSSWDIQQWGARALAEMRQYEEAREWAEECLYNAYEWDKASPAGFLEELLLRQGLPDTAFTEFAIPANWKTTRLATFRAIQKKYPAIEADDILDHLAAHTPGEEGKWFAAAKSVGLLERAAELAETSPTDLKTLLRAARDFADTDPHFASRVAYAALHWLAAGYGYDVLPTDVTRTFALGLELAARTDSLPTFLTRVDALAEAAPAWGAHLKDLIQTAS